MWTYLVIALVVAVVTGLFLYLDSRLTDTPKKRMVYIKVIAMNVVMVWGLVYVLTWLSPNSNLKEVVQSGGQSTGIAGPTVQIKEIGEQMLSGDAPF